MSKGWKDIELLAALTSNNSPKFNQLIDRLREEARGLSEILGNGEEDAVSQAIDKAVDWLRSDEPFKVNHPMPYVKRLIHNSIIDYGRTRKEQAVSDDEIQEELAWIDEEVGDLNEIETPGWHGIKSDEEQVVLPREYPEHLWLRILDNLYLYEGWQTQWIMSAYLFDKFRGKGIRVTDRLQYKVLKNQQDERWQQYKLTMGLIHSIPSMSEQQIIKYYLWGYRVTDIAMKLNVTKPYISKVVNKWMKVWRWDKHRRDKTRIILLTYHLAKFLSHIENVASEKYRKEKKEKREESWYEILTRIKSSLNSPDASSKENKELIRFRLKELEQTVILDSAELKLEIEKCPQISSYFSDMKDSDAPGLMETCARCHTYWYENWYEHRG